MIRNLFLLLTLAVFAGCAPATQSASNRDTAVEGGLAVKPFHEGDLSPVGVIPDARLHDAARNKDLDLTIEYPTRGEAVPLIVFSHGYGGSKNGYVPLTESWASHGYVCIKPSHADAGALREPVQEMFADGDHRRQRTRPTREEMDARREKMRAMLREAVWEKQGEAEFRERARDISFIIDSLDQLEQKYPELKGRIDRSRIGVGGHSLGALTTMLLAGADSSMGGAAVKLADPRIRAAIAMSPQGPSPGNGLSADSWRGVKLPILYMTGSRDHGAVEGENPAWRRQAYERTPAGAAWFAMIDGASHLSFTGRFVPVSDEDFPRTAQLPVDQQPGTIIPQQQQQPSQAPVGRFGERERFSLRQIEQISLTFWNAQLKHDSAALQRLNSGSIGGVTIEHK